MPAAVSENTLGTLFGAAQRTADAARGARPVDRFRAARTDTGKAAFRRSGTKVRAGKAGNGRGTARRGRRLSGWNHRLTGPPRRHRDAGRGTPVLWNLRAREWQNGMEWQQLPDRAGPGAARRCQGRSAPKHPRERRSPNSTGTDAGACGAGSNAGPICVGLQPSQPYHLL